MNHPPTEIILDLLDREKILTRPDEGDNWPCYVAHFPEKDLGEDSACLYDSPGEQDGRSANGVTYDRPSCQLRVRSTDYSTAYQKIIEAMEFFDDLVRKTIRHKGCEYFIQSVSRNGMPLSLGTDDKNRVTLVLNFTFPIKRIK